ncbi:MAG: hypothetical protein HC799_03205 [Limnothrix sp. RL_2_0]|nr:hypothetical protein [Limnothrix sp. RL_2_0]
MYTRRPLYEPEEFAKRGEEIYASQIQPTIGRGNLGRYVAIDLETEVFEIADDILSATTQLFHQEPDAQPWIIRIGESVICRMGARSFSKST